MDNPIQRLLDIVVKARSTPVDTATDDALKKILSVGAEDTISFVIRLGELLQLIEESYRLVVDLHEDEQESANHWRRQLLRAFVPKNLLARWADSVANIDDHSVRYLRSHAKHATYSGYSNAVPAAELAEIKENISELVDLIISSQLPEKEKKYLHKVLMEIIIAIDSYFITGVMEIQKETSRLWGELAINGTLKQAIANQDQSFKEKLWSNLSKVADVLQVYSTVAPLLPSLQTLIGFLPK